MIGCRISWCLSSRVGSLGLAGSGFLGLAGSGFLGLAGSWSLARLEIEGRELEEIEEIEEIDLGLWLALAARGLEGARLGLGLAGLRVRAWV
jgi:hypothetical protein